VAQPGLWKFAGKVKPLEFSVNSGHLVFSTFSKKAKLQYIIKTPPAILSELIGGRVSAYLTTPRTPTFIVVLILVSSI
jgi:hypothetical protein